MSDLQNVQEVTEILFDTVDEIQLIGDNDKPNIKMLTERINQLISAVNLLNANNDSSGKSRDRGPDSTRTMTEDDAEKIMLGEYSALSHKDAALKLGLSYGQIYSARKGFTFKTTYQKMIKANKA